MGKSQTRISKPAGPKPSKTISKGRSGSQKQTSSQDTTNGPSITSNQSSKRSSRRGDKQGHLQPELATATAPAVPTDKGPEPDEVESRPHPHVPTVQSGVTASIEPQKAAARSLANCAADLMYNFGFTGTAEEMEGLFTGIPTDELLAAVASVNEQTVDYNKRTEGVSGEKLEAVNSVASTALQALLKDLMSKKTSAH